MLVSVPKILEVLRDYIAHEFPEANQAPPPGTHWMRNWWHFRRVHRSFGWKFWAFITGAAPLDPAVEEFFSAARIPGDSRLRADGNRAHRDAEPSVSRAPGTVGTPVGGVEVRLAEDGEVLVRGGNVSQGYYGQTEQRGVAEWTVGCTPAISARMDAEGRLSFADARRR